MRNTLIVLLAGSLLSGCLDDEESNFHGYESEPDDPSGNSSPTISGDPAPAVLFGEMYDFEPDAIDPDGDALTFSITGKPGWANFEASTGRLYGQPTQGDVGSYDGIVISVSDGSASQSLPTFSVSVSQAALGSVTLSWNAPTQNADGTPLLDLAGYKIYYGRNSGIYDHEIQIDGAGTTTYVVGNLTPDTYYFAATSVNSAGVESDYSGEAVRTVN